MATRPLWLLTLTFQFGLLPFEVVLVQVKGVDVERVLSMIAGRDERTSIEIHGLVEDETLVFESSAGRAVI